jgi:hypothetical protein
MEKLLQLQMRFIPRSGRIFIRLKREVAGPCYVVRYEIPAVALLAAYSMLVYCFNPEDGGSSEMSIEFHRTTQRYISENKAIPCYIVFSEFTLRVPFPSSSVLDSTPCLFPLQKEQK